MMDGNEAGAKVPTTEESKRKPRVALMGEFSAGKSTLTNLLVGCQPLPVRITATSVPPVWIAYGEKAATLIRHDGSEEILNVDALSNATLETAKLIRLTLPSEILKYCDLLDMPGISDPNLENDIWNELIEKSDCILWCTHATQAWRQSEASTWNELKGRTNGNNLLIVTQFDKLKTERDRARVLARIESETDESFRAIFPVSLINALESGEDENAWKLSGADKFIRYFVDMLLGRDSGKATKLDNTAMKKPSTNPDRDERFKEAGIERDPAKDSPTAGPDTRVMPKRVCNNARARLRNRPDTCAVADSQAAEAVQGD